MAGRSPFFLLTHDLPPDAMTYAETLDFLFNSLPMYQRQGKAAYKANLDNTHRLDKATGHPYRSYPCIHIAGTNGKGSVSHMLASVLQQAGIRTGLYTSPHLLDFRERIRISGRPIPEEEVTGFVERYQALIREITPSFFEMTVAMAFEHFARQKVDVAVIETGLGGRLDSTNIISPVLSVITNISLEHTEFLGSDLPSIAREKGGIIKAGVPLVLGRSEKAYDHVLLDMAGKLKAPLTRADKTYSPLFHTLDQEGNMILRIRHNESGTTESYTCDLTGLYQQENLITALTAIRILQQSGWSLPPAALEKGFSSVSANTGIMGRWQSIGSNPRSICDTAHNRDGIAAVMEQLEQVPRKELHMVWGMVSDKDLESILPLLPQGARYYFTPSSVPRSMDAGELRRAAAAKGLEGKAYPSVEEAYRAARQSAGPDDLIFTGGSTFVVADLLSSALIS
ncbi:MAG: folylpolyglutamate synthase/dihydrofolate synthase family protein [Bacteroidota bacterium]